MRTSVFFKGCPLKCEWCHNPEGIGCEPVLEWTERNCIGCRTCESKCLLNAICFDDNRLIIEETRCSHCLDCVKSCPSGALGIIGKEWDVDALVREASKDDMFFAEFDGGVTVSGGEPLMQYEFVAEFLKKIKEKGISTALDTCGFYNQNALEAVFPYVDVFLYDIKLMDSELHKKYTGVTNKIILGNFAWLISEKMSNTQKQIWVRTPLISEVTATDENIHRIGSFLSEYADRIDRWELCAFNNVCKDKYKKIGIDWKYKDSTLMTQDEARHCFEIAQSYLHEKTVLSGLIAN